MPDFLYSLFAPDSVFWRWHWLAFIVESAFAFACMGTELGTSHLDKFLFYVCFPRYI